MDETRPTLGDYERAVLRLTRGEAVNAVAQQEGIDVEALGHASLATIRIYVEPAKQVQHDSRQKSAL